MRLRVHGPNRFDGVGQRQPTGEWMNHLIALGDSAGDRVGVTVNLEAQDDRLVTIHGAELPGLTRASHRGAP
jgi:hypothetical protein